MLKKVLLYIFFFHFSFAGISQLDTININQPYYSIDQGKKLILINASIQELNQTYASGKIAIVLNDTLYQFSDTIYTLHTGIQYHAKLNGDMYGIYFSNLPIVRLVVTDSIRDSPKVPGHFEMVHPALETLSHLVGLEYRGASSQAYPKKSMELEFWADSLGDDSEDISLLGMLPKNNSWNLQALYVEACRTNSMVSNAIWEKIHHAHYLSSEPEAKSGIRMKYVEVFLNNSYYGLYAIGQKVNRDLLKLKKNEPETVRGELIKCDDWTPGTLFTGAMNFDNSLRELNGFEYSYPKNITDWGGLNSLIDFVVNALPSSFRNDISTHFNMQNAVDYFLFLNLLRANDNHGKNIYLARYDIDSSYFYVPWDLDGTFGYMWDGSKQDITDDLNLDNGLFARLWNDSTFRSQLSIRWNKLRTNELSDSSLTAILQHEFDYLTQNGVYEREGLAWVGYQFNEANCTYMADWLQRRLQYLDFKFNTTLATNDLSGLSHSLIHIFPNPVQEELRIRFNEKMRQISIYYIDGNCIATYPVYSNNYSVSVAQLPAGIYLLKAESMNGEIFTNRFVRVAIH